MVLCDRQMSIHEVDVYHEDMYVQFLNLGPTKDIPAPDVFQILKLWLG